MTNHNKLHIFIPNVSTIIHIRIPPTGYTAVATASWNTVEGTMRVLRCYCDSSYLACSNYRVPSKILRLTVATVVLRRVG